MKAVLILKDGTVIHGEGFGAKTTKAGELVFNTSMTGYQEALTDPSYAGQLLVMTYPLIGNYGISKNAVESSRIQAEGFIVKECAERPEHSQSIKTLNDYLTESEKPGISGIDTRYLVRKIRNYGVMPAILATYGDSEDVNINELLKNMDFDYSKINFVEKVSTKEPITYGEGKKTVVLIDYGVKMSIVRQLVERGLKVVVMPFSATVAEILEYAPSGILLSNGPGDPAILTDAHKTIRKLSAKELPIFGVCLGHQLLAHAFGGSTYKMKFGHRGSNHPVLDRTINKIAITTQNHGYAVDVNSIGAEFEITHINLNDNTVEGMKHKSKNIISVQYHPEAAPGPHDSRYLFDRFLEMLS